MSFTRLRVRGYGHFKAKASVSSNYQLSAVVRGAAPDPNIPYCCMENLGIYTAGATEQGNYCGHDMFGSPLTLEDMQDDVRLLLDGFGPWEHWDFSTIGGNHLEDYEYGRDLSDFQPTNCDDIILRRTPEEQTVVNGIGNQFEDSGMILNLFPSTNQGTFNLNLKGMKPSLTYHIEIFDTQGRSVYTNSLVTEHTSSLQFLVDLTDLNLPASLYYLRIMSERDIATKSFIITYK